MRRVCDEGVPQEDLFDYIHVAYDCLCLSNELSRGVMMRCWLVECVNTRAVMLSGAYRPSIIMWSALLMLHTCRVKMLVYLCVM